MITRTPADPSFEVVQRLIVPLAHFRGGMRKQELEASSEVPDVAEQGHPVGLQSIVAGSPRVFWEPNEVRGQIDGLDLRALQYIDDRLPNLLQLGQQLVDVGDGT